jgi:hypothetical protein
VSQFSTFTGTSVPASPSGGIHIRVWGGRNHRAVSTRDDALSNLCITSDNHFENSAHKPKVVAEMSRYEPICAPRYCSLHLSLLCPLGPALQPHWIMLGRPFASCHSNGEGQAHWLKLKLPGGWCTWGKMKQKWRCTASRKQTRDFVDH